MTKQEHKYAQVLRWLADGEKIQVNVNGWTTLSEEGVLRHILTGTHKEFRLAPSTIRVNGVEVPAPERFPLKNGSEYYVANPIDPDDGTLYWDGCAFDMKCLSLGLVYLNKEDAIARAKAMLLTTEESQEARIAAATYQTQVVPTGWKLVPVEPTEEQLWCLYGKFVGQLTTEAKLYSDMLSAAPQPPEAINPECWCQTCRPLTLHDMRFIVCPDCGNERCPKANNHANACTNSNAIGQKGSSWEHVKPTAAAPQSPEGGGTLQK